MSFGRLLAAGKSWVGGDGIGRYRMQKHIRLPKFISPQNPFKKETAAETQVFPAVTPNPTDVEAGQAGPVDQVAWWMRIAPGLRRFGVFCLDHNPFSRSGKSRLPAIPRFGRSGIQGELSLDKVKVMRGDLTHADLEVVSVGAGGNQAGSPAWKKLSARIFDAGLK